MYNRLLNSVVKTISNIAVKKNYGEGKIAALVEKYAGRFGLKRDLLMSSVSLHIEFLTGLE